MMRKIIPGVIILCFLTSLLNAQVITGNDADEHGCKGSAGYTWSELKKQCIQPFAEDLKLRSADTTGSYTSFAALIFSKDRKKAELIMAGSNVILIRTGKKGNYTWKKGDWSLREKNGYQAKKANKLMYYL